MNIETAEEVNAKKARLKQSKAQTLATQAREIYVAKGKKVIHLNTKKDNPDDTALTQLLLGLSGNLPAPTVRKGKTLVVGFDEETYTKVFGSRNTR